MRGHHNFVFLPAPIQQESDRTRLEISDHLHPVCRDFEPISSANSHMVCASDPKFVPGLRRSSLSRSAVKLLEYALHVLRRSTTNLDTESSTVSRIEFRTRGTRAPNKFFFTIYDLVQYFQIPVSTHLIIDIKTPARVPTARTNGHTFAYVTLADLGSYGLPDVEN